jgi:NADPH-dependent 2,4-dienoyl-CoA reductase/sulfur reductase-like enzyme/rhodanese-related sulfurtransferase
MTQAPALPQTVVVIGGVAGGMSAATRLRRIHESADIIVIERGGAVSFANCGLPYHVGGVIPDRGSLVLQQPEQLKKRFNIDVHLRTEATSINRGAKTVSVTNRETGDTRDIAYDALVLSPGSTPFRPPIPGVDDAHVLWSLDDMDRLIAAAETAKSAIVVGGGFIGLELAENLVHRGISTTLVEALPQLMPTLDVEMAWPLVERARFRGLEVRLSSQVQAITDSGVTLSDGSAIDGDMVVVAVGARPNVELAVAAGLEMGEAGGVVVDDQQRTSDPHIWAVGDVAQKQRPDGYSLVPLAGLANRHGRLAADSIAGRPAQAVVALGTSIVGFFGVVAASTGYTERVLRSQGRALRLIHTHPINHAGYYPDARQMALKLIVDPQTDLILGAQAVGEEGVDKRIDVIATAMAAGLTASDLMDLELSYAPQFSSAKDPVNMLGYVNENRASGEKAVQWHEVADLLEQGWKLVDVRTDGEYTRGAIPGSQLITLDELRDHVAEFLGQKVIVTCRVGQRGHTAASILMNHGIEVANLDGGYLTWQMGMAATTHPELVSAP